jgi:hypothetical protein
MNNSSMMPEAMGRYTAFRAMPLKYKYIIFLDADEIIDGQAFKYWLDAGDFRSYLAMKFANYWFWRRPNIRAKDYLEDSVVMLDRDIIHGKGNPYGYIFDDMARTGYYDRAPVGKKKRQILGVDGLPMISHYSWCRTEQGMLNKVRGWGHKDDFENLEDKVKEEFSRDFNGRDFLGRGVSYEILEKDPYDIKL